MTDSPTRPGTANASRQPPATFIEVMNIPQTRLRTAVAIMNNDHMQAVSVTFSLKGRDGNHATYAALCPRCNIGEISVDVALDAMGAFAEPPACPSLCIDCEDRLDAILEPAPAVGKEDEPGGRETMNKYLRGMARRWE